ncbi:MAG: hypothetical protein IJZ10_01950 [Thermoguttaceae bacterium]|nr:hypothetical protein [Thermoguttaceae bacterium]
MQILSILPNIPFFPCRRRSLLSRRLRACALLAPVSIFAPLFFPGCAGVPSEPTPPLSVGTYNDAAPNPLFVQTADPDYLWNAVVDVVDNYFEIEFETPIRVFERETENGERFTSRAEGRIDTKPTIAAGVLEPWRKNSVACEDRWLATFQTIRRSAVVRVVPDAAGYLIYLSVYNEIEDLKTPMGATIGFNQNFIDDFSQLTQPVGERAASRGWIPTGRDARLEKRMLEEIAWRLGNPPTLLHQSPPPTP